MKMIIKDLTHLKHVVTPLCGIYTPEIAMLKNCMKHNCRARLKLSCRMQPVMWALFSSVAKRYS